MSIIGRGAEAILKKGKDHLEKQRVKKGYRLKEIDEEIIKTRTRREANLIRTARRIGVNVPSIIDESKETITMEFLDGKRIKDVLNENNYEELCTKIAYYIALLHKNEIIHGDLTTSNMMFKDNEIYFIDFGLGFKSSRIEDKASDLYLMKQALDSTHFNISDRAWQIILKAYQQNYPEKRVMETLKKIEKRRRYVKIDMV